MFFEQIKTPGLGCFSYMIGCPLAGIMTVVDPRRDTDVYLRASEENGMRITHIFDTHVHADHISGAQQLRDETNADIYIHESAPVIHEAKKVREGDEFTFGNAFIRILHTPGHTPNSISLLIFDLARSPEPEMILTGDLLFVGDTGRPDLPGKEILDEQIENLYNSLYKKLGQLPGHLEVYPAHGQGSLCGQGMSAKQSSTLGYERLANNMLKCSGFKEFKRAVLSNLPARPQSFSGIIQANIDEVPILSKCGSVEYALSAGEVDEFRKTGTVLDLRDGLSFSAAHIPGSIHVDASAGTMLNWIGTVIAPVTPIILILPAHRGFEEMCLELQRIGYDKVKGWLKGGVQGWLDSGRETQQLPHISASSLQTRLAKTNPPSMIDVRTQKEIEQTKIEGSVSMPFDRILEQKSCPHPLEETVVVCQSGYRASIAASLLQAKGCANISVLSGGMNAWNRLK